MVIDIDGPNKGTTTLGKDIFQFRQNRDKGVIPLIQDNNDDFSNILVTSWLGTSATAWILKFDNADYLQIQSVSGSTATCKNGNTMTESHPRCK